TFLEARINLTFDYYVRTTSDLLLAVNIPPSSGFDRPIFNEGEIENRGIEIALNTVPIENDNFQWNLGFNLSRNRNEVLRILSDRDFGPPLDAVFTGSVIQEGSPLGAFFGYQTNGVYATQEEADADLPNGTLFPKEAGEYRYVDVNGDGELNEDDRTIIGDPNPDFIYGITSTFKYKNFSLDVAFQGVQGNDIFWTNARLIYPGGVDARGVHQDRFDNRWTPENPNAEYPRFNINSDENIVNDRLIFDGSFLRLRNIVLAYDIPSTLLEKIKIQRLRVYASATNLLTFTDYPGWNPDVNTTGQNSVNQGVDRNGYPLAKSFQFGINLTF
ncbi:MAG: SusC/RagA family TonB-linked outer membrane protein, partial [Bacteroidota bacterium]